MPENRIEVGRLGDEEDRARRGRPAGFGPLDPIQHLDALAELLDNSIPVPGLKFRIGIESLLGMIPILGDLIGAAISSYILFLAAKLGAAKVTLLRMALNVAIESAVGVVPIVGDIFDFGWKANRRNVDLLKAHLKDPARARRTDWVFALLMILALAAVLAFFAWAAWMTGRALVRFFRG
jgi:hypothetical protein